MPELSAAVSEVLDAGGWVRSSRLALLDFDVAVYSDDPVLVELVEDLYGPLVAVGEAAHVLSLGGATVDGMPGFVVALDGVVLVRTPAPSVAFAHLLFEANQQAIEQTVGPVLLHAAGAVAGDRAIVLPGPMGAGKSTLVAGLIARGLGYLTDEIVALDAITGLAVAWYAKPISLGAMPESLMPLRWEPRTGAHRYLTAASGVIPARSVRADVDAAPAVPGLVVLPCYAREASTEVTRLASVDALMAVAAHTFHLERPGTLRALADRLEGVPCYRLVSGALDEAVDAVLELSASEVDAR